MIGLIEPVAYPDRSNQEIAGDHKCEIAFDGRLEGPANDRSVVDAGDCRGDIEFRVGIVEQFNGDSGKRPGSCVFQHVKEREIEHNLSRAKNPRLSRHWLLTGGRKSRDGLP